jgi:hypothetical protein
METQMNENYDARHTSTGYKNPTSARKNSNEYNKAFSKDYYIKILTPLKPIFDSNKIKEERDKMKVLEKMMEKNKENLLLPIRIQPKFRSIINDNLPPIFTEAHKQVKNDQISNNSENDSIAKIATENPKNLNQVNRLSSKKLMNKIAENIKKDNKLIPQKHYASHNKIENRVSTMNTQLNDEESNNPKPKSKSKKKTAKKETIIAKEKSNNVKNISTLEDWKKRNRLEKDAKVFICFPGYPDMRKALLNRGWQENQDQESLFFDFKCSLSTRNIEHDKLEKFQVVNHFENSGEITRKGRLCLNLRNLKWFRDVNIDSFFPRCYDISEINDFDDFIEDFKITKAESVLKEYYYDIRNIPEHILETCINIFERKLLDIDEELDRSQVIF